MKKLCFFIVVLGMVSNFMVCHAQLVSSSKAYKSLDEFRHEIRNEFEDFRKQVLEEYVAFVRNPWTEFDNVPAVPMPKENTVPPVVMPDEDKEQSPLDNPIAIDEVVCPIAVSPQPIPTYPVVDIPIANVKYFAFSFFGTDVRVRFDIADKIHLNDINNIDVADALERLSDKRYDNTIVDCLSLRDSLRLSDWAYLQMLKSLADSIQGVETNEATILLSYLYMQSGYRMRLGSDGVRLYMLYATDHMVYDKVSYEVDGIRYYGIETLPAQLLICKATFPKEQNMSLLITTNQRFADDRSELRRIVSTHYPDCAFSITVNKNLLQFYDTYPTSLIGEDLMTRWAMYANAPMEQGIRDSLYPQMKEVLKGLSKTEAVSKILNWVQTGFEYEYDDKVWGEDRAFFAEETLFYPYCDCEDRAILLTRLVRDLLGLKCLLVYYPGHLASAVEFEQSEISGDYILLDGHRYVIADATYINAPLGYTMTGMNNATAKVILLTE